MAISKIATSGPQARSLRKLSLSSQHQVKISIITVHNQRKNPNSKLKNYYHYSLSRLNPYPRPYLIALGAILIIRPFIISRHIPSLPTQSYAAKIFPLNPISLKCNPSNRNKLTYCWNAIYKNINNIWSRRCHIIVWWSCNSQLLLCCTSDEACVIQIQHPVAHVY